MRSYKEIAEETGTTIADVREAMSLAEKREMPVDHYYDDYVLNEVLSLNAQE